MAQQLHNQYGFSYDNLKVLLGGWSGWQDASGADSKGYPIETTAAAPGAGKTPANRVGTPIPQIPNHGATVSSPGAGNNTATTPNLAPVPTAKTAP